MRQLSLHLVGQLILANVFEGYNSVLFFTGDIVISATPMGSVTVGETETIVLECMLEGADVEDGIVYSWEKEGDDTLPSNAEANGGMLHTCMSIYNYYTVTYHSST